jgi:hypothetical protein
LTEDKTLDIQYDSGTLTYSTIDETAIQNELYSITDSAGNNIFKFNGEIKADNIQPSMTITHETDVSNPILGRFCETTGEIYPVKRSFKDCITGVTVSTSISTKILGIIVSETQFASHGDVLVRIIDSFSIGDLLVPTENGSRIATEQEKLFIMMNGLPRVRIMSSEVTKINDQDYVACFIS